MLPHEKEQELLIAKQVIMINSLAIKFNIAFEAIGELYKLTCNSGECYTFEELDICFNFLNGYTHALHNNQKVK